LPDPIGQFEERPRGNARISGFSIGEKADPPAVPVAICKPERKTVSVSMHRKTYDKLQRGKLRPEKRIDLHGMTLAQAQPALTRFILSSHSAGCRLVLVITGKGERNRDDGGPIPVRMGILRQHVPQWLARPPLSSAVLEICPAHRRHGGGGAYYVYLRRRRKGASSPVQRT